MQQGNALNKTRVKSILIHQREMRREKHEREKLREREKTRELRRGTSNENALAYLQVYTYKRERKDFTLAGRHYRSGGREEGT